MLSYAAALVPILFYLAVLYTLDGFRLARGRMLTGMFVWGVASVGFMLLAVWGYRWMNDGRPWTAVCLSPCLEETIKGCLLIVLILRRRIAFFAETQIYGQMVGGGFAFAENIVYIIENPTMSVGTALVRGFTTSLLHMGCTSLVASLALLLMMAAEHQVRQYGIRITIAVITILALLPSILIHTVFNSIRMPLAVEVIIVMVVFFVLSLFVSWANDKMIVRWLDMSIIDDISLIAAIREGRLAETHAGQYLLAMREKYEPLVFFDICVYLSAYLEMVIKGKAQMMMREAQIEDSIPSDQDDVEAKLTELTALARRIPSSAHMLLRPVLHSSDQNRWAIRHLR